MDILPLLLPITSGYRSCVFQRSCNVDNSVIMIMTMIIIVVMLLIIETQSRMYTHRFLSSIDGGVIEGCNFITTTNFC